MRLKKLQRSLLRVAEKEKKDEEELDSVAE